VITLIHERPWQTLVERLDAIVSADASLAAARALLVAPITLLAAIAEDVEGALGDDQLALERLRALLSLSAIHAHPFSSMRALLSEPGGSSSSASSTVTRDSSTDLSGTTVVDTGALVLAGLAAARAGVEVGLPDAFVDHALALSLAATPAEALSRAVEAGVTDSQLRAALAALGPSDMSGRNLSMAIASFVADPSERARWRALDALFALIRQSSAVVWEGATSEDIVSVKPHSVCEGGGVEIRIRLQPHSVNVTSLSVSSLLSDLAAKKARVVFASSNAPAVAKTATSVNKNSGVIRVVLPAHTHAGWVGVTSQKLVAESNKSRTQLREFWSGQNKNNPLLARSAVPVATIALLPKVPMPPRRSGNRFTGGLPAIELFAVDPKVVEAGGDASLRWRVSGADRIEIEPIGTVRASGSAQVPVAHGQSTVRAKLTAINACGQATASTEGRVRVRITDLRLSLSGSQQPPHDGAPATVTARLTSVPKGVTARLIVGSTALTMHRDHDVISAEIPAENVTRQLTGRVRAFVDRDVPDDEQRFGPLNVDTAAQRRVVVVRPAVLTPEFGHISIEDARTAVQAAGRELGIEVEPIFAPTIDMAGFAIDGIASGSETPATRRLLERLNMLSAQSSGFEDALWVALLPSKNIKVSVSCPGDAVATLAVASPSGLADVLRQESHLAEPPTDRVRVIGTVDALGRIRILEMQRRRCPVGAGASVETGAKIFGMDSVGRDISTTSLRLTGSSLPAPFVALLPASPELVRIEIRLVDLSDLIDTTLFQPDPSASGRWVAKRIDRVVGEPKLSHVRVEDGTLRWDYTHTRGVNPDVTIELGRDGGWWPIQRVDRCATDVPIDLDRLNPTEGDRLRVVATDRWNTAISTGVPAPAGTGKQVIARYAGGGRFWVDLGDTKGEPHWKIGDIQRQGPVITVPQGYTGPIQLKVRVGKRVIKDVRVIETLGFRNVASRL
jgi:hypothetical protein